MATRRVQYDVGGMSCSFCAESIRKAYDRTEGVEDASVSLAHEEVRVEYDDEAVSEVELKDTPRDLGYTIRDPDKERQFEEQQEELERGKRRLILTGLASLVTAGLMLFMIFVQNTFESQSLRMDLIAAFSFNGIGVAAATTGLVHPVFAMIAMVLSVSAVLANSFAGQLLAGDGITTDFTVETGETRTDAVRAE